MPLESAEILAVLSPLRPFLRFQVWGRCMRLLGDRGEPGVPEERVLWGLRQLVREGRAVAEVDRKGRVRYRMTVAGRRFLLEEKSSTLLVVRSSRLPHAGDLTL